MLCILISLLMEDILRGPPGITAVSHVVMVRNGVLDHAPFHRLLTVENNADDFLSRNKYLRIGLLAIQQN